MKKAVLSMFLVGALVSTSCKGKTETKEEVKEVETEVVTETETELIVEDPSEVGFVDITIPEFSNDAVVENLKSYALYARDYIAADGNVAKITGMAATGKKLLDEGREMVAKLPKEDQDNYAKVIAQIQAKMAPVN